VIVNVGITNLFVRVACFTWGENKQEQEDWRASQQNIFPKRPDE
jgi:hypothetical protein